MPASSPAAARPRPRTSEAPAHWRGGAEGGAPPPLCCAPPAARAAAAGAGAGVERPAWPPARAGPQSEAGVRRRGQRLGQARSAPRSTEPRGAMSVACRSAPHAYTAQQQGKAQQVQPTRVPEREVDGWGGGGQGRVGAVRRQLSSALRKPRSAPTPCMRARAALQSANKEDTDGMDTNTVNTAHALKLRHKN